MPKRLKDNNGAAVQTGKTRKRKAGKDIIPRLRVIDGASWILMASSRGKSMQTNLLWGPQPKDPETPFLFLFDLPDGDGGTVMVSLPMGVAQAQAVYAAHPRRVPKDDMPPECPLEEVIEELEPQLEPEPEPSPNE